MFLRARLVGMGGGEKTGTLPVTPTYLPMGDQQLLDGLALAGRGIKDSLHVQLLEVLVLLVPPAQTGCVHVGAHVCSRSGCGGWVLLKPNRGPRWLRTI